MLLLLSMLVGGRRGWMDHDFPFSERQTLAKNGSAASQQGKQPHCICIRKRGWKGAKSEVKHFAEAFFLKSCLLFRYFDELQEFSSWNHTPNVRRKANFHNLNIKHFICHKQHLIPVTFGESFSGKGENESQTTQTWKSTMMDELRVFSLCQKEFALSISSKWVFSSSA